MNNNDEVYNLRARVQELEEKLKEKDNKITKKQAEIKKLKDKIYNLNSSTSNKSDKDVIDINNKTHSYSDNEENVNYKQKYINLLKKYKVAIGMNDMLVIQVNDLIDTLTGMQNQLINKSKDFLRTKNNLRKDEDDND